MMKASSIPAISIPTSLYPHSPPCSCKRYVTANRFTTNKVATSGLPEKKAGCSLGAPRKSRFRPEAQVHRPILGGKTPAGHCVDTPLDDVTPDTLRPPRHGRQTDSQAADSDRFLKASSILGSELSTSTFTIDLGTSGPSFISML